MHITSHVWVSREVVRRDTYKGAVSAEASLPVDATTVLGTVLVLASVLPTSTLSVDAVKTCYKILLELQSRMDPNAVVLLLPHQPVFALQLRDGKADLQNLKDVFRELGLPWCKLGPHFWESGYRSGLSLLAWALDLGSLESYRLM